MCKYTNEQQFRLNKINEIKDYFLAEIRERELISKNVSKYIASLDYFDKSLNVLSILSGSISIASFATVIGAPAGIIGASCGLTFSITSGFVKKFLKTIRSKKEKLLKTIRSEKEKHNKIVILARSKSNSIESKISHKNFETIINKEKKYWELKESIGMMNSQSSDAEKVSLIEEGRKIGINEVIRHNETINNSLK